MKYSLSVVSHKSGRHLEGLFSNLSARLPPQSEVILTINVPEEESFLKGAIGLPLKIIRNSIPLGFGENHNQAFASSSGDRFVIVNPDVRILGNPWELLDNAFDSNTGACAPIVVSSMGDLQDNARYFPTVSKLFKRLTLGIHQPDYMIPKSLSPIVVDWVAGMFVMFDSSSYRAVGGFDTGYFMYLEDADICRRVSIIGKKIKWVPTCEVIHDAQRASRTSIPHMFWHIKSMIRFLCAKSS